jgi:hypothetical protein
MYLAASKKHFAQGCINHRCINSYYRILVSISSLWAQMPRQQGAYKYMGCGCGARDSLAINFGSVRPPQNRCSLFFTLNAVTIFLQFKETGSFKMTLKILVIVWEVKTVQKIPVTTPLFFSRLTSYNT